MAEYTKNFNLIKPGQEEFYNVQNFNNNTDVVDTELKNLEDAISNLNADGITLTDGKTISEKFNEITTEIGSIEELDTNTKLNIVAAINEIYQALETHKADYVSHTMLCVVRNDGQNPATYTLVPPKTISGELPVGAGFVFQDGWAYEPPDGYLIKIEGATNTPSALLLSSGAKAKLKVNGMYTIRWNGTNFILQGEGGEYGTAQAQDVLSGKTFGTEEGVKTGTMPNIGKQTGRVTTKGGKIFIDKGFHDGTGYIDYDDPNHIASNIKSGVKVGGVEGKLGPFPTNVILTRKEVMQDAYNIRVEPGEKKYLGVFDFIKNNDVYSWYSISVTHISVGGSLPYSEAYYHYNFIGDGDYQKVIGANGTVENVTIEKELPITPISINFKTGQVWVENKTNTAFNIQEVCLNGPAIYTPR